MTRLPPWETLVSWAVAGRREFPVTVTGELDDLPRWL